MSNVKLKCPGCGSDDVEHVYTHHLCLEDFMIGSPTYKTGSVKGPEWGIRCSDCGFTPDNELEE